MHLQSDGISIISKSPAGSFALIVIGKTTYTKNFGDDPTATGISSMILKKYANRWVKFTSASDTGVDDTTNLAGFAKSIASLDGGVTIAPKVTRGSLNGEDVVIVTESDGSSFSIAATGTPYVLQAVKVDSSKDGSYGGGKLTFSDYGKRISITAPAGALDVDSLMNQPGVAFPSGFPTDLPSGFPTDLPSGFPTDFPTDLPSGFPTAYPSGFPTAFPTDFPSS
jgi:hypothetical protein